MVVLGAGLAGLALVGFGLAPGVAVFVASGLALGTGFYMIHNSIQTRVTEVATTCARRGLWTTATGIHRLRRRPTGPGTGGPASGR